MDEGAMRLVAWPKSATAGQARIVRQTLSEYKASDFKLGGQPMEAFTACPP
jgi:hypothetical protein